MRKKFVYKDCVCKKSCFCKFLKGQKYLYRRIVLMNGQERIYVVTSEKDELGKLMTKATFGDFFRGEYKNE